MARRPTSTSFDSRRRLPGGAMTPPPGQFSRGNELSDNPVQAPAGRPVDLRTGFAGFRSAIAGVSVISGVINILALTGSLYMLQVYDRVLSSHSIPTLVSLSLLMVVLFAFHGVLDMLRSQASGRAAALFDRRMARPVHAAVLGLPLKGISRSMA